MCVWFMFIAFWLDSPIVYFVFSGGARCRRIPKTSLRSEDHEIHLFFFNPVEALLTFGCLSRYSTVAENHTTSLFYCCHCLNVLKPLHDHDCTGVWYATLLQSIVYILVWVLVFSYLDTFLSLSIFSDTLVEHSKSTSKNTWECLFCCCSASPDDDSSWWAENHNTC